MGGWLLLSVPATPLVLTAVLFLSDRAEVRFLSPRSLIVGASRSRWSSPDYVEDFVARQVERLLQEQPRSPAGSP